MSADDPSKNSKITARTFAEQRLLVFFLYMFSETGFFLMIITNEGFHCKLIINHDNGGQSQMCIGN